MWFWIKCIFHFWQNLAVNHNNLWYLLGYYNLYVQFTELPQPSSWQKGTFMISDESPKKVKLKATFLLHPEFPPNWITMATGTVLTSDKDKNKNKKTFYPTYYTQFCCEKGQSQDLYSPKTPRGILKFCLFWRLYSMCCSKFCLVGEVVFLHSKHVNKISPSTFMWVT